MLTVDLFGMYCNTNEDEDDCDDDNEDDEGWCNDAASLPKTSFFSSLGDRVPNKVASGDGASVCFLSVFNKGPWSCAIDKHMN